MRLTGLLSRAVIVAAAGYGGAAYAATCQTDGGATCFSSMPVGGYCECNVHGQNVGGTIISEGSGHATAHSFQPGAPTAPAGGMSQQPPPPPQ
jgi:hypothetical protein